MILLLDVVKRVRIQQLDLNPNFLTRSKNGLIRDLTLLAGQPDPTQLTHDSIFF